MSAQLALILTILLNIMIINGNEINCELSSCQDQQEQCHKDEDCIIQCTDITSCQNATIICPNNQKCTVICTATNACHNATINAALSSELMINGCTDNTACTSMNVYCPPHNTTAKKCRISGNNNIRTNVNYYAINGFSDTQFDYSGDYSVDSSYMFCSSTYTHSCAMANDSFICHPNGDISCNDGLVDASTQMYTTTTQRITLSHPIDNNFDLLDLLNSSSSILYLIIIGLILVVICIGCCLLYFIHKYNQIQKVLKQRVVEIEKDKSDAIRSNPDATFSPFSKSNKRKFRYEYQPEIMQTNASSHPSNYITNVKRNPSQLSPQNRHQNFHQQYNDTTKQRSYSYHKSKQPNAFVWVRRYSPTPPNNSTKSIHSTASNRHSMPQRQPLESKPSNPTHSTAKQYRRNDQSHPKSPQPIYVQQSPIHSNAPHRYSQPPNNSTKSIHSTVSNRYSMPQRQQSSMRPISGNTQQIRGRYNANYNDLKFSTASTMRSKQQHYTVPRPYATIHRYSQPPCAHIQHSNTSIPHYDSNINLNNRYKNQHTNQMQHPQSSSMPIHTNTIKHIHMIPPKQTKRKTIESVETMLTDGTYNESSTTLVSSSVNTSSQSSSNSGSKDMEIPVPNAIESNKKTKIVVENVGVDLEEKQNIDVNTMLNLSGSTMEIDGSAMTLDQEPQTPSESNVIQDDNTPGTALIHDVDSEASSTTSSSAFTATEHVDDMDSVEL